MNITEARNKLTSLPEELIQGRETLAITKQGKPVLAPMPRDLYESLIEIMEIMSDPEMMQAFRDGVQDIREGRTRKLEDVKAELDL